MHIGANYFFPLNKISENKFQEFNVHIDGIEQMVKLRGGLAQIGLNTCLAQIILRQARILCPCDLLKFFTLTSRFSASVDHLYSALTEQTPRFTIDDSSGENIEEISVSSLDYPPNVFSGIYSPELLTVLDQLRSASRTLEDLKEPVTETVFFSFGNKRALIEEHLLRLGTVDSLLKDSLTPIEQCCQIAALLYVQTALAKVNCKVYRVLVAKLKDSIQGVSPETIQSTNSNLLLWMLLVGGGAAPFNSDRLWYIETIKSILHTPEWMEVEQRLQGWPWRPKYCVPWRATWRDAVTPAMTIVPGSNPQQIMIAGSSMWG